MTRPKWARKVECADDGRVRQMEIMLFDAHDNPYWVKVSNEQAYGLATDIYEINNWWCPECRRRAERRPLT
jgi:hypothetical protein